MSVQGKCSVNQDADSCGEGRSYFKLAEIARSLSDVEGIHDIGVCWLYAGIGTGKRINESSGLLTRLLSVERELVLLKMESELPGTPRQHNVKGEHVS